MDPKPISVQLYSVREQAKQDFPGTIRRMAEFGYAAVEFAGLHGHSPEEIRTVLDDAGLVASSAHSGLITGENLDEQVHAAGTLGYDTLIGGYRREAWDTEEGIRAAAEAWQTAAELLKPHGLRAGYHNHWWEMQTFDGKLGLEIFAEAAPDVLLQLDTYWACNFGAVDVPAFVRKWASRITTLHIKDGPLEQGEPHVAVGAGKMDIPPIIDAADPQTLRWLIVELDECATDMLAAVQASVTYLTTNNLGQGR